MMIGGLPCLTLADFVARVLVLPVVDFGSPGSPVADSNSD